jgi:hypothetical protein
MIAGTINLLDFVQCSFINETSNIEFVCNYRYTCVSFKNIFYVFTISGLPSLSQRDSRSALLLRPQAHAQRLRGQILCHATLSRTIRSNLVPIQTQTWIGSTLPKAVQWIMVKSKHMKHLGQSGTALVKAKVD